MTHYLFRVAFRDVGTESIPSIQVCRRVQIRLLDDIPVVGANLFTQHVLTVFALAFVPIIWFVLYAPGRASSYESSVSAPRCSTCGG